VKGWRVTDNAGYGSGRRRRRKPLALSQFFTDRQTESDAFAQSLHARDQDLTADRVRDDVFDNVLLYYGFGGLGKTQLSLGLENWIDSEPGVPGGGVPEHWGGAPTLDRPIVIARWDLNDSGGNLDPLVLLLSVRAALHRAAAKTLPKKTWRAFDVAFAAYAAQVRPGQPLPTDALGSDYTKELPKMVAELAIEASVGFGAGVGAQSIRDLAMGITRHVRAKKTLTAYPELAETLDACLAAEPGSVQPDLAGDLLFLIDVAIKEMAVDRRPLLVIFVDHLERVQSGGDTRAGERLLNQLVAALPHALFVMTGRNALDWYRPQRTSLAFAGETTWPCLLPDRERNPRPHLLETLSKDDAREWIRRQAEASSLPFRPGVVDNLVEVTGCWPVHIDAVFELARVKADGGASVLTLEDLSGSFDDVVQRLLEDLPADERAALQAASLLPYFDVEFVHSVTGREVTRGAIERLTRRAVVLDNHGNRYPCRVHDEVRRAVRAAGPFIQGGWSPKDWKQHAEAALVHALDAAHAAREARDDEANLSAVGLAITLAAEFGVRVPDKGDPRVDGVVQARRRAPSNARLLPLIPTSDSIEHADAKALVQLIEVISVSGAPATAVDKLTKLVGRSALVETDVLLWRAYRLRDCSRYTEAAEQLAALRDSAPDLGISNRRRTYARQTGVTHSMARRFRDAEAATPMMDPDQAITNRLMDRLLHGHLDDAYFENQRSLIPKANPRYALELEGALHRNLARAGRLDRGAAGEFLQRAIRMDHVTAQRTTLAGCALHDLAAGLDFDHREWPVLDSSSSKAALGEILAFKVLRGDADQDLLEWMENAQATGFGRSRIPVEMLLDYLGYPLPAVETQWLEPVETVRARWVGHYLRLLGREANL
jgi:hypothetical protein